MPKSVEMLLEADPRYRGSVWRDSLTGSVRPATVEDFHAQVAPLMLANEVPTPIREQFDKALNAYVYSWFCYDLATLAEQQAYAVIELAIREKIRGEGAQPPRNLGPLLNIANARGWLGENGEELVDVLPRLRNELAHGSQQLNPIGSLEMIALCSQLLNAMFRHPATVG